MMDPSEPDTTQYFAERPRVTSHRRELKFLYQGRLLSFLVDRGVFASTGLDPGTALLIENLEVGTSDKILDLGCGWGAIGIAAAISASEGQAILTDVNHRAARLARENLARNRIHNAEVRVGPLYRPVDGEKFDLIASNPPYHAGRELIVEFLEQTPQFLRPGGRLVMVGKGNQGIRYYQDWLHDHWDRNVEVKGRGSGYRVLEARPEPRSR